MITFFYVHGLTFQTVMIIDLLLAELHNLEVICNLERGSLVSCNCTLITFSTLITHDTEI